jgi:transposase-like protein
MGFTPVAQRWQIVGAWRMAPDNALVAQRLGVSPTTVRHWVRVWKATGAVDELPGKGRKPILGPGAAARALAMLKDPAVGRAGAAAKKLQAEGTTPAVVSGSTVLRAARGQAKKRLTFDSRAPGQALTPENKAKRVEFAAANRNRDWRNVMFTDRKKFLCRSPGAPTRRGVYRERGEPRPRVPKVNRPWAYNVYLGLTLHGLTRAHVVAGSDSHTGSYTNKKGQPARNITASQYTDVLTKTFLPEGRRLLLQKRRSRWVLQQDGDPTHSCAFSVVPSSPDGQAGLVTVLPNWPPHSPDLNPIENLWAIVDAAVQKKGCKTRQEWEAAINAEFAAFPQETITHMYNGMRDRMDAVLDREGDWIGK